VAVGTSHRVPTTATAHAEGKPCTTLEAVASHAALPGAILAPALAHAFRKTRDVR